MILWRFHWKIQLLGGRSQKTNILEGLPKRMGEGGCTVSRFKRGLGKKRGWCFWGGLIPRCTLCKFVLVPLRTTWDLGGGPPPLVEFSVVNISNWFLTSVYTPRNLRYRNKHTSIFIFQNKQLLTTYSHHGQI